MTGRERTAVVTGAGSGIGLAVARRLAAADLRVVAVDVDPGRVEAIAAETGVIGVAADVTAPGAPAEILAAAGEPVDVLANVAGIMDGFLPPHEVDDDTWERVFAVNVTAPMALTRAVLPGMLDAGRGAIVNVASEAALRGSAAGAAYTASKHALIGLTRSTAVFYGERGIRCNAVCPGAVVTNIDATSRSEFGSAVAHRYFSAIPSVADPDDVATTICWLAGDDARHVNGAVLAVDGGWSAI